MILRIGHRGARGYSPENTLVSFEKALELDVDMVELDVYACKTGEIIAFHDARIDRITKGTGRVEEKNFQEIRNLHIQGEKVPTLEEVLDLVNCKAKVNIEIKGDSAAAAVAELISKYVQEKEWKYDDFLISSFNHYELQDFNSYCPEVKIGAIIACIPIGYAECAQKINAYSFHLSKEFINQEIIDDAHKRGMQVYVYTVNEPEDIERMKMMGVDGIVSDYPDRI